MKQMKKTMIALVLLTAAGLANAQTRPHPQGRMQAQQSKEMTPTERGSVEAERMTKRLGLTADQKQSWQMAATERLTANRPIREKLSGPTTPEERLKLKGELRENKATFEKKVNAFLNDDQRKKLSEQKQKRQEGRKHQRGNGRYHQNQNGGNK